MSVRDFSPIGKSDDMTEGSPLLTRVLWGHCQGTMHQLPARDGEKSAGDRPDTAHLSLCSSPALASLTTGPSSRSGLQPVCAGT